MTTFARAQYLAGTDGTDPATRAITPTAATSLLLAVLSERSGTGHTPHTMGDNGATGSDWVKVFGRDQALADGNARHSFSVWGKVAGSTAAIVASGDDGTSNGKLLSLHEYTTDTAGTWSVVGTPATADTGTGSTSPLAIGPTGSAPAGDNLVVAFINWRTQSDQAYPGSATNSFTGLTTTGAGSNGRQHGTAWKQDASGGTFSTSIDWSGSGHECAGGIAVFKLSGAGDETPPTLTGSITEVSKTDTSISVSWPTGADNVAVTSYEASTNGGSSYSDLGLVTSHTFTGLSASTEYEIRVRAKDAAGNVSTPALATAITTEAPAPDTTPPTMNGAITVTGKTATGYTLNWPAASDNVGVTGYEVSLNGGTDYTDVGLVLSSVVTGRTNGATDAVRVRAYDAADNVAATPLSASVLVEEPSTITVNCLDFAEGSNIRMRMALASGLRTGGCTLIWREKRRTQDVYSGGFVFSTGTGSWDSGAWTALFVTHGCDGTYDANGQKSNTSGPGMYHEIAGMKSIPNSWDSRDFISTPSALGTQASHAVVYDEWIERAVTINPVSGTLEHVNYVDFSDPSKVIRQNLLTTDPATPTNQRLDFGAPDWIGDGSEDFDGLLTHVKVFSRALSTSEIRQELDNFSDTPVVSDCWYSNYSPTAADITDKKPSSPAHPFVWHNGTATDTTADFDLPASEAVTATTSLGMAVQLARSATAGMGMAVQAPATASTSVGLAVRAARSAGADLGAAVQQARAATALVQLAVQASGQQTTGTSLAVQQAQTVLADLSAAVQQAREASASMSLQVQAASAHTVGVDMQVQVGSSASVGASLAVLAASTLSVPASLAVQTPLGVAASIGLAVNAGRSATVGASLMVQDAGGTSLALQAAVQFASTATAAMAVAVQRVASANVGLAAAVQLQRVLGASIDAAVRQLGTASLGVSLYVYDGSEPTWPTGRLDPAHTAVVPAVNLRALVPFANLRAIVPTE